MPGLSGLMGNRYFTAYTPGQGNPRMEGGYSTSTGAPMYTLEQYRAGQAPYVTGAVAGRPSGQRVYTQFPGVGTVPIGLTDTGGGLKPGQIDLASSNRSYANNFPYQGQRPVYNSNPMTPIPPSGDVYGTGPRRLPQGVFPGGINITGNSPQSSNSAAILDTTPNRPDQYFQFLTDNNNAFDPYQPGANIGQGAPATSGTVSGGIDITGSSPSTSNAPPSTSIGQNIPLGDENVLPNNPDTYFTDTSTPAARAPAPAPAGGPSWIDNASNGRRMPLDANGYPIPGGGPSGPMAPDWAQNAARPPEWGGQNFGNFAQAQNSFIPGLIDWNGPGGTNPLSNESGFDLNPKFNVGNAAARFGLAGLAASARSGLMPSRQL